LFEGQPFLSSVGVVWFLIFNEMNESHKNPSSCEFFDGEKRVKKVISSEML